MIVKTDNRTITMRLRLNAVLGFLLLACLANTLNAANIPGKLLRNSSWELITFPNAALNTDFVTILGDDLDVSAYQQTWYLFSYDTINRQYQTPVLTDVPIVGKAYWIVQFTGSDVTIDVPGEIQQPSPYSWNGDCQGGVSPCLPVELASNPGQSNWHFLGSPHVGSLAVDDIRIVSDNVSQSCNTGCQLTAAFNENVVRNVIYTYNSASNEYEQKTAGDSINTWEGFLMLSLPDAVTPVLHLPQIPLAYFDEDSLAAVVLMPGDTDQRQDLSSAQLAHLTNGVYNNFADSFDFLFMMVNNAEKPASISAFGRHYSVKNDILGIGKSIFDNTARYGSAGRLRGINSFPYRRGIIYGPGLHEMMHSWGNFLFDTTRTSHWGFTGFSGGKGQLGGFDSNTLTVMENNTYSVQSFGTIANGGNSLPYNSVELYLMGLIDSAAAGDVTITTNPEIVDQQVGTIIFTADSVTTLSFDDFLSQSGIPPRTPALSTVNDYTSLTVLLSASVPTIEEINETSEQARIFTATGDDGSFLYNFNEATGFLATLSAERPIDHTLR